MSGDLMTAARRITSMSEDDIRDYEQGLCLFCGAGHEPIPGPRGGVRGERKRRPIHEPTCSFIQLREAVEAAKPNPLLGGFGRPSMTNAIGGPQTAMPRGVSR